MGRISVPKINESEVEKYFCALVKMKLHGLPLKLQDPNFSGLPDRTVICPPGKIFFAEIKSPEKKPRKLQEYVHELFKRLGFRVYVIDSFEKAEYAIREEQNRL